MRDETKAILVLTASVLLTAAIAGIIITATGKILVLEVDGLTGKRGDSYGNYEEQHIDGGKFRFYAE